MEKIDSTRLDFLIIQRAFLTFTTGSQREGVSWSFLNSNSPRFLHPIGMPSLWVSVKEEKGRLAIVLIKPASQCPLVRSLVCISYQNLFQVLIYFN